MGASSPSARRRHLPCSIDPAWNLTDEALDLVGQRLRRARWIAGEHLSAEEALQIPLDFDPTPEHHTHV